MLVYSRPISMHFYQKIKTKTVVNIIVRVSLVLGRNYAKIPAELANVVQMYRHNEAKQDKQIGIALPFEPFPTFVLSPFV